MPFIIVIMIFIGTFNSGCNSDDQVNEKENPDSTVSEIKFDNRFGFKTRPDGKKAIELRIDYKDTFSQENLSQYLIFVNGAQVAETNKTTLKFANLFEKKEYTFTVRALYEDTSSFVNKQIKITTPPYQEIPPINLELSYNGYSAYDIGISENSNNLIFDVYQESFSAKGIINGIVDGESILIQKGFSGASFEQKNVQIFEFERLDKLPQRNLVFVSKKEDFDLIYRFSFFPRRLYKTADEGFTSYYTNLQDREATILSYVSNSQEPYQLSQDISNILYKIYINNVLEKEVRVPPNNYCNNIKLENLEPNTNYLTKVECYYENTGFTPKPEYEGNISRFAAIKEFEFTTNPSATPISFLNANLNNIKKNSVCISWNGNGIRICETGSFVQLILNGVTSKEFSSFSKPFVNRNYTIENLRPFTTYTGSIHVGTYPETEPVPFSFTTLEE